MSTMKRQCKVYYGPSTTGVTYPKVGTVFSGSYIDILWKEGDYAYIKYDISSSQYKCGYVKYRDINVTSSPNEFTPNMTMRYVNTAGPTYMGDSKEGLYPIAGSVPFNEPVFYTGKKAADYVLAFIEYNLYNSQKKRAWFPAMQLSYSPPVMTIGKRPADMNLYNGISYYTDVNMYYKAGLVAQCTWFCWGRAHEKCNRSIVFNGGNHGSQWYANAISGYAYKAPSSSAPMANAIACFSDNGNTTGHVVFIENIIADNVYYTEANNPHNNILDDNDGVIKVVSKSQFKTLLGKSLEGYLVL